MLTVTQTTTALLLILLVTVMSYGGTISCVKFKGFSSNISAKLIQIIMAGGFKARSVLPDWKVDRMAMLARVSFDIIWCNVLGR